MSDENQTIAIVAGETLIYQRDGQNYQLGIGTSAWHVWLQTTMTFPVRSPFGTFTVRRERAGNQRGDWYWRAYRKRGGTLHRVYVGKADEVTIGRLNAVAKQLFGQGEEEVSCWQERIVIFAQGPTSSGRRSVKILRLHSGLRQKHLRTQRTSWTRRPPQGASRTVRRYRL